MSFAILAQCNSSGDSAVVNLHNLCTYIGLQFDRSSPENATCFVFVNELAYFAVIHLIQELAMKHLLTLVLLVSITGCGATANNTTKQTEATNKTAATAEADKPKKDMICRSEKALGSNMKTKVCRPKS
ncbi:hypothetical protein EOE67_12570 [Rheinheimera riviphila]|uniref:Uncharacterized protein n=1 Tax=Rheinheimera riviphila TaxID=1834037 RepID=A0A437QM99_9GAMM|nr:hypothetical protein [Rheinheimera riviphila]RVU35658.1 hypothetical protein EOE67_12570 [Rheinheimera riviphila]